MNVLMVASRRLEAAVVTRRAAAGGRAACTGLLLLGASALINPVAAIEVRAFQVARDGERYHLHSDMVVRASLERVNRILHRFDQIPSLDPDISEVTVLGTNPDGSVRMRLAARQCFLWICIPYGWTQDVSLLPSGDIYARMVAGGGDIESGWIRYRTEARENGTRLVVDAEIDASGIVFPAALIEPLMQARLRDEALETARLVEQAAN